MKYFSLLVLAIPLLSIVSIAQTPSPTVATTPSPSVNQTVAVASPSPTPESKGPPTLPWVVEMFASGVMLVAVAGVLLVVLRSRNEKGTLSVNPRHIQFASVCLIVPTILILGLEKVLTSETTATLIGGLAGYLLSNLGKYEPSKDDPTKGGSTMQPPNSPLSDDPVDVEIEVTEPEDEKKTFKARMKRLGELPRPKNPLEKPEN